MVRLPSYAFSAIKLSLPFSCSVAPSCFPPVLKGPKVLGLSFQVSRLPPPLLLIATDLHVTPAPLYPVRPLLPVLVFGDVDGLLVHNCRTMAAY